MMGVNTRDERGNDGLDNEGRDNEWRDNDGRGHRIEADHSRLGRLRLPWEPPRVRRPCDTPGTYPELTQNSLGG
jgi:hypothetical protein